MEEETRRRSVLVICGFIGYSRKIETHVQPIANASGETHVICMDPYDDVEGITYYHVPIIGHKIISQIIMQLVALYLTITRDYDLIVSFSLIPYGTIAFIASRISRTPAQHGIIGGDLDVHAEAWYGKYALGIFRRVESISVAGEEYRERLIEYGIDPTKIHTVLHPVGNQFSENEPSENPEYDILWLTRLASEKDPLLFVEVLAELRDRSIEFSAAIVGEGPLYDDVEQELERRELDDTVDMPGWTDNPEEYYRDTRVYVLTSEREMLPLTLVEAMFVGTASVVPPLGAIPDTVDDGENGTIVESRTVDSYADAIQRLLLDDELRERMATNAPEVESTLSYEAVTESWCEILENLGDIDS
ncbi:glycosyltransferase family 4 protein [Halorubrum gandharaense]